MAIKSREEEGLPEYFATFADMMTLLLTFFVLLFSMSTLDPVKMADLAASMEDNLTSEARQQVVRRKTQSQIKREVEEIIQDMNMSEAAQVTSSPRGTTIIIGSEYAFAMASADLSSAIYPFLNNLIPIMMDPGNQYPIAVDGHTDNVPISSVQFPSNWELSSARASQVVQYCIRGGVPGGKLRAVGYADRVPFGTDYDDRRRGVSQADVDALNSTDALREQNRRVEITFLQIG